MEEKLKRLLAARQKRTINDPERIASAVLIPIFHDNKEYHIVLIKRTDTVTTHKGQISFPGGGRDIEDKTLLDTAIREASEEIGLWPENVEILGELDDEITTTSNFVLTPFVGMIPWPYNFIPAKAEVAEIITVPLKALQDEDNFKPAIETMDGGIVLNSYNYFYRGNIIWGATARILNKLLSIISGDSSEI